MDVVLEAEHRAQAELANCQREADARLAAAREEAGYIHRRTQERISRLHQNCEEKTAARVRAMKQAAIIKRENGAADRAEEAMIREAAARLAARLTGADDAHR